MDISGRCIGTAQVTKITVSDGIITETSPSAENPSLWVLPGFLDLQVNGYRGFDYTAGKITPEAMIRLVRALAEGGTTRHAPTLVSAGRTQIVTQLKAIDDACSSSSLLFRAVPLIHMEGPYIAHAAGARGAHAPDQVRDPDPEEYLQWQEASGNRIGIITLAPERPGALEFIEAVSADGVIPAIGHTEADRGLIREAVQAGARLSAHLGNGMAEQVHRHANPLISQLACEALWASVISDGEHLPEDLLNIIYAVKGYRRMVLVSDVIPSAGLAPGRHNWNGTEVTVEESGRITLPGSGLLAGASSLLSRSISHIMQSAGTSLEEAVTMCTVNPAALTGLSAVSLIPRTGEAANIVLCRANGSLVPAAAILADEILFSQLEEL